MPRDQETERRALGILLKKLSQSRSYRANHLLGNGEKAGVAQVSRIVEEVERADWCRVEIDSPVHETCCAADGEDDGVHVVHGNGLDAGLPGASEPVG